MKLNIENIKSFLDCDESFLLMLFKSYTKESEECISNLEKGLKNEDWKLVKGAAHKMLSSTRIFGFEELTQALINIENFAVDEESRPLISDEFKNLQKHQNEYLEEIEQVIVELNHETAST